MRSCGLQDEAQLHPQFFDPASQRVDFVGLVGDGLQFGVEMQQRILQPEIFVAIFFQKLRTVLEGESTLARRQQRKEELRLVTHLATGRHHFGDGHIDAAATCAPHRGASSSTRRFETVTPK